MKRLITLSVAVIYAFTITASFLVTSDAEAVDAKLMGWPQSIEFDAHDTIKAVIVQIKKGWANSTNIELAISITSINATTKTHGSAVVPISAGTLFTAERDVVDVRIDWSSFDKEPRTSKIEYTVEVQILAGGQPLGDPKVNSFYFD